MAKKVVKVKRAIKNFYSFENYKPNNKAKPVMYKGTQYLSKAQCMALEGITRKELEEYLADPELENEAEEIDLLDDDEIPF